MVRYVHLPDDIVYEIMLRLDPYSLDALAMVSARHLRFYQSESFWSHKSKQDYHITNRSSAEVYFSHLLNDGRYDDYPIAWVIKKILKLTPNIENFGKILSILEGITWGLDDYRRIFDKLSDIKPLFIHALIKAGADIAYKFLCRCRAYQYWGQYFIRLSIHTDYRNLSEKTIESMGTPMLERLVEMAILENDVESLRHLINGIATYSSYTNYTIGQNIIHYLNLAVDNEVIFNLLLNSRFISLHNVLGIYINSDNCNLRIIDMLTSRLDAEITTSLKKLIVMGDIERIKCYLKNVHISEIELLEYLLLCLYCRREDIFDYFLINIKYNAIALLKAAHYKMEYNIINRLATSPHFRL